MKTKVIIENGTTEIVLTPENEFERQIIENIYNAKKTTETKVRYTSLMGDTSNHSITITANINDQ